MKRIFVTGAFLFVGGTLLIEARASLATGLPQTVILSAAPQDAEVFTTWSAITGSTYVLHWKAVSASEWRALEAGSSTARAVTDLPNGVTHVFRVEARLPGGGTTFSSLVEATPRPRPGCAAINYYPWLPPVSFFCTKQAMDEYLAERAINPLTLRCRQQRVAVWNADVPDCLYLTPDGDQLLLLRSADTLFAGANQYPGASDIRQAARKAIWGTEEPFAGALPSTRTTLPQPSVGRVTRHAGADSFELAYPGGFPSRVTWFVPKTPVAGRYAIYHEGHGGPGVEIGAETIDWLLDRGWAVIAVDMPLIGLNGVDARPGLEAHGQLDSLDDGLTSPVKYFLNPVRAIVDWIVQIESGRNPDILLIGRSGGGLTAYLYGAVDPRVDLVVSVAGGRPISERLDAPWGAAELGDYEQTAPHLYNGVGHEHLMLAAGTKGSLYVFNQWDGCCFRIQPGSAFVDYLTGASELMGKPIAVFVDPANPNHSIGPLAYVELDAFLGQALSFVPRPPTAPSGMRIISR